MWPPLARVLARASSCAWCRDSTSHSRGVSAGRSTYVLGRVIRGRPVQRVMAGQGATSRRWRLLFLAFRLAVVRQVEVDGGARARNLPSLGVGEHGLACQVAYRRLVRRELLARIVEDLEEVLGRHGAAAARLAAALLAEPGGRVPHPPHERAVLLRPGHFRPPGLVVGVEPLVNLAREVAPDIERRGVQLALGV